MKISIYKVSEKLAGTHLLHSSTPSYLALVLITPTLPHSHPFGNMKFISCVVNNWRQTNELQVQRTYSFNEHRTCINVLLAHLTCYRSPSVVFLLQGEEDVLKTSGNYPVVWKHGLKMSYDAKPTAEQKVADGANLQVEHDGNDCSNWTNKHHLCGSKKGRSYSN